MLDYDIKSAMPAEQFHIIYRKSLMRIIAIGSMTFLSFIFGLYNFTSENNAIWFQRSGSLIVVFSVYAEFLYLRFRKLVTEQPIDYGNGLIITRMESFKRKNLPLEYSDPTFWILHEPLIVFSSLIGTIIWGYGDLIYRLF